MLMYLVHLTSTRFFDSNVWVHIGACSQAMDDGPESPCTCIELAVCVLKVAHQTCIKFLKSK